MSKEEAQSEINRLLKKGCSPDGDAITKLKSKL